MSTGRWTTIATTALMLVAITTLVVWLRATAPEATADTSVADRLPDIDLVTCEELEEEAGALTQPPDQVAGRALSGDVLACPFAFDGLRITYVGEVVGDVLRRDGGSWVLVNDDPYALRDGPLTAGGTPQGTNSGLTVWLPDPLDELADEPGRTDLRGDVLVVTGQVLRADPADGGGLTVRAEDASVLADAVPVEAPVHWRQVGAAAVLSLLALATLWRERRLRER